MKYKGHNIVKFESMLQIVYVVDGDEAKAYWSLTDAKRAINGKPVLFEPVNIECNPFFEQKG